MLKERKAIFLILFAALLWGTTGTAQTFAPAGAHPVAIGAVRLAVGGFALLIFVLIQGNVNLRQWKIVPTILSAAEWLLTNRFFSLRWRSPGLP